MCDLDFDPCATYAFLWQSCAQIAKQYSPHARAAFALALAEHADDPDALAEVNAWLCPLSPAARAYCLEPWEAIEGDGGSLAFWQAFAWSFREAFDCIAPELPMRLTAKGLLAGFPSEAIGAALGAAFVPRRYTVATPQPKPPQPFPYGPRGGTQGAPVEYRGEHRGGPPKGRRMPGRKGWAQRKDGHGEKAKPSQPLRILAPSNPYRTGTKAWDTFAMFQRVAAEGGTVATARLLDKREPGKYDIGHLRYASRDGYITFSKED